MFGVCLAHIPRQRTLREAGFQDAKVWGLGLTA